MKSRKLLLSLAVFFLVGAFVPTKASSLMYSEGEGEDNQPEAEAGSPSDLIMWQVVFVQSCSTSTMTA